MASNYDDVLGQLQAAGLDVTSLDIGRMRRCRVEGQGKEKRGWYMLHELRLPNGDELIVGTYGVWRGNENHATKVEVKRSELTQEQRDAMRKRLAEDKRRADAARQAEAERAAQRAAATWRRCSEEGDSPYLRKKGVLGHGVRYSAKGSLLIPMCDTLGNIQGLQVIRSGGNRLGKEFWPAGLAMKGHFHLLGMPSPGGPLLVAEGYATAASLHQATGLPVAVAFTAGNLVPVAEALRKRYRAKLLLCADDDDTQKCQHSACRGRVWVSDGPECPHCGQPHGAGNAGVSASSSAALSVGGAWMAPRFADPAARRAAWLERGEKLNDFNDLHLAEGLHVVRAQVEARLMELQWRPAAARAAVSPPKGEGVAPAAELRPIDSLDELLERFSLVYGQGGTVFDHQEHQLVALSDMRDACLSRELHRAWAESPDKRLVRVTEVGFDPTGKDAAIKCNLWQGWPTVPKAGKCDQLLKLLNHMCAGDRRPHELYQWVLRWLAYPIQHPGAKMKTTLVIHGPQGTGKNVFFESVMRIYGRYGWVIDQSAIEDKFNDWASRKLFLIADEVVARSDLYHIKNKLKAFITGEQIRINPKNMAAYWEANHVNLVFLSNEAMPVVLEEDDRRHAVIWTPEKLSPDFYAGVHAEIEAGGVEALHDYLLSLPMDGFGPATLPPMTDAKRELIDLSKDSPSRFLQAMEQGDIGDFPGLHAGVPLLSPMLGLDLYELYTLWCSRSGLKAINQPRFANHLMRKHGARTERKRYLDTKTGQPVGPHGITYLRGGQELPPGESESEWLGERVTTFKTTLKDYRGGVLQ